LFRFSIFEGDPKLGNGKKEEENIAGAEVQEVTVMKTSIFPYFWRLLTRKTSKRGGIYTTQRKGTTNKSSADCVKTKQ
jgi:hypothetical protein